MIRVLIVDDAKTMQHMLNEILSADLEIEVIGMASDAYEARNIMVEKHPDVVCLDINMPEMDGITFLRKMMLYMPTPTIMVSSLTKEGAKETLMALDAGAVSFVTKPNSQTSLEEFGRELISQVKIASAINVQKLLSGSRESESSEMNEHTDIQENWIIAIGASTGGTQAIARILERMPENAPGIVIVQHIPKLFSGAFASRLDRICTINIKEADDGDIVQSGWAYVAPGDRHMKLEYLEGQTVIRLEDSDKVSGHKPSVDVLFESLGQLEGDKRMAVLLTGMGSDGAKGMLRLRHEGVITIAQDEQSSVVYGMPHEAYKLGAVQEVCSLTQMASTILKHVSK